MVLCLQDSSNVEEANGENSRGTPNSGTSQSHVGVSSSRPSSSPVGSSGSRSNTPAPIPGELLDSFYKFLQACLLLKGVWAVCAREKTLLGKINKTIGARIEE